MNTRILNRDNKLPDDGWHQFEVPGEHVNHRAKAVQVIDDKAVASIVNRFTSDAAGAGDNFPGMLVDKEHFSLDPEKESEAMGWAMQLRNRAGIPEARIEWTGVGRPKIEGKDYKFFSTVYSPDDVEVIGTRIVNKKVYQVVRPLRLDRLALTNDPNNRGGKPISNRSGNSADAGENQTTSQMKNVIVLLGLAEDAPEASVLAALQTLKNRLATAEGSATALTNRATTAEASLTALQKERDELLVAVVESDLDKYAAVIANRDEMKKLLIANRANTLLFFAGLKKPDGKTTTAPITNRGNATPPNPAGGEGELTGRARTEAALKKQREGVTATA